jgi:beta-glucosidase
MRIDYRLYHKPLGRVRVVVALLGPLMWLTSSMSLAAGPAEGAEIDALVQAMTLDEKLSMLHGTSDPEPSVGLRGAGYVAGVPRLGIPPLRMADGPAGVRTNLPATALPAPVALSATFDPGLARLYGQVMGLEGRARNQDVLLAPMVNLIRVPQAGRAFETLGEDPLLIARIVAEEVRGIQGAGLIATVKHYAANNQEYNRHSISANVDERTLHEIYLPGFEGAVKAGAGAVMCAYNKVNGICSCNSSELLTNILRNQWGFTGWVMTDWFAERDLSALQAWLDMEMPGTSFGGRPDSPVYFDDPLREAMNSGEIPASYVDQAVRRILVQMDRVGLLNGSPPPRPTIVTTVLGIGDHYNV